MVDYITWMQAYHLQKYCVDGNFFANLTEELWSGGTAWIGESLLTTRTFFFAYGFPGLVPTAAIAASLSELFGAT